MVEIGDRSNIAVVSTVDPETRVYLYGHYMGDDSIRHALKGLRSGRADDSMYLARIIFSSMVSDYLEGETGYGIATYRMGDEHPLIVINPDTNTVHLEDWRGDVVSPKVSNEEFIKATKGLRKGEYGSLEVLVKRLNGKPNAKLKKD